MPMIQHKMLEIINEFSKAEISFKSKKRSKAYSLLDLEMFHTDFLFNQVCSVFEYRLKSLKIFDNFKSELYCLQYLPVEGFS